MGSVLLASHPWGRQILAIKVTRRMLPWPRPCCSEKVYTHRSQEAAGRAVLVFARDCRGRCKYGLHGLWTIKYWLIWRYVGKGKLQGGEIVARHTGILKGEGAARRDL